MSQEIIHRENQGVEKQSSINSSQVLIYSYKNNRKESELKLNDNLNDNLAQNNCKINYIQNIKDFIPMNNENAQINNKINIEKSNNIELDNEWNESKINFDNISIVSKVNSNDNNNEQSNIIDNNFLNNNDDFDFNNDINKENIKKQNEIEKLVDYDSKNKINDIKNKSSFIINSCENSYLEEKIDKVENNNDDINILKREKTFLEEKLKEKSFHIEILKKALNDSILRNNKGSKNVFNLGIVLEYSKSKLENEKLKKNIIMQQILCDDMKKELETLKGEKDKLIEKNTIYEEKIKTLKDYEFKWNEKCNQEKRLKDELNKQKQLCFDFTKEINNLNKKNNELIELTEKMRKDKCIINIEEKNVDYYEKILKEKNNQINELKLENINLNNNIEKRDINGNINNNINIIINDSYKNIENISKRIKSFLDKINENKNQNELIILKVLKDYNNNINPDFNGNISMKDKLMIIKEFTNIIKIKLEKLFTHFEIFQKNNFNFERIKFEENEKNIFVSTEREKNDINNDEIDKRKINNNNNEFLKNNNIFKKIDLLKYKNSIKTNENNKENNDFVPNKLTNYKNNFMEKKRIIFKSSFSEISKSPIDSMANNSRIKNDIIGDLFSEIFKEKYKKKKNIINLKTKEINNLMNNKNQSAMKIKMNSFVKVPRGTNINFSEDIAKMNKTNIFLSNKKVINNNEKNDNILSLNNTSRKIPYIQKDNEENSIYVKNPKENNNHNYMRKIFPLILTNTSNNHKKNLYNTKTNINNKSIYTSENSIVLESTNKKRNGKNKSNLSLEMLQKELYSHKKIDINKNHNMNGLVEEIMKPSFLKGNNILSFNNKQEKKLVKISSFKAIKTKK